MRRLFSHISRFTRLLLLVAGLLLLLAGVLLWQLSRELPAPACRWLEQKLSRGRVSFAFREASISLWRGIRLREVRVHPKRSLGAPLLYADEIELDGALRFGSQPAEWIDEITFRGLQIGSYDEWPTSIAGRPMLAWADLFDPAQPYGALFARPVRIVAENSRIHCVEAERIVFMLRPRKNRLLIEDLHADFQTPSFRERLDGELTFDFEARRLHSLLARHPDTGCDRGDLPLARWRERREDHAPFQRAGGTDERERLAAGRAAEPEGGNGSTTCVWPCRAATTAP